jgi:hypothetical protein
VRVHLAISSISADVRPGDDDAAMVAVFLGREALGAGLKRQELRRWYKPMFRGVYTEKWARPTLRDRVVGAWLTSDRVGVIAGVASSEWTA